jgi:hypothetical protein
MAEGRVIGSRNNNVSSKPPPRSFHFNAVDTRIDLRIERFLAVVRSFTVFLSAIDGNALYIVRLLLFCTRFVCLA